MDLTNSHAVTSPGPESLLLRAGGSSARGRIRKSATGGKGDISDDMDAKEAAEPLATRASKAHVGRDLRMAILADDLTGACDAAAPFARQGPIPVMLHRPDGEPDWPIWAVDLDVRSGSASAIRAHVERASRRISPTARIFVKIDSAGRSPVGAMIDGVSAAWDRRVFVITPAFPARGALLIEGMIVLDEGGAGHRDFLSTVETIGRPAVALGEHVLTDASSIRASVCEATVSGVDRIVVDASSDKTLTITADYWLDDRSAVAVGSSGLARAISRVALAGGHQARRYPRVPKGPLIIVSGSAMPAAWLQLSAFWKAFPAAIRVDPSNAAGSHGNATRSGEVVYCGPGPSRSGDDGAIARWVARRAAEGREYRMPRGVVLVGGSTARAFLVAVASERLDVWGEIAAGITHGLIRGGGLDGVRFVIKSGRFGDHGTLVDAAAFLSERESA